MGHALQQNDVVDNDDDDVMISAADISQRFQHTND